MFGNSKIIKNISIEGMSCMHCAKKVEGALKELKTVKSVKVDLENKNAEVVLKSDESNENLKTVVEDLGYKVIDIKN